MPYAGFLNSYHTMEAWNIILVRGIFLFGSFTSTLIVTGYSYCAFMLPHI